MPARFVCALLALVALPFAVAPADAASPPLSRRWVYLQINLQVEENVGKASDILRRAAAAGYNGVVLADYKLNILDRVPGHYFKNAEKIKALAAELKLELIPTVAPIGYSDGLLAHNPNLAEGLPAKEVPFVMRSGFARLDSELVKALPGGEFEERKGDAAAGWSFQDGPGKASFVDTDVKHGGASSLRFEDLKTTAAPSGNGRVSRVLTVKPWRQYHASIWIKTEKFENARDLKMFAMGKDGLPLSHMNLGVKPDQPWTEHHVIFNSLENSEVRFYCGAWGGKGGKFWLDDAKVEETAFVNLLRRPSCPLVVKGEDGTEFKEGVDYAELRDPKLGSVPWAGQFDAYHEPPVLKFFPGAKLKDGQKIRVSFWHTVTVYDNQVTCCLGDPEVFKVLEDQISRVERLLGPTTYFLSHDEIRVGNWCPACRKEGQTAGQLLAENLRHCVEIVRKVNPKAKLCVWSDMFDPAHNARKDFYLMSGDLAGSWEGLPKEMVVVNWNSDKPKESLPFFAKRGNGQVLAGYYDADPARIRGWLDAGAGLSGIDGAMYTTWTDNFKHLEAFAKSAWGEAPAKPDANAKKSPSEEKK